MRLDHNTGLWGYPSTGHIWPNTNAEARTFLQNNPGQQNLFALSLDDGRPAFVPAVGYGGVEGMTDGSPYLETGPVPVIRPVGNRQVAYVPFRNGQSKPPDGRWDGHMGEMVLDDATLAGYKAGDLRFVQMSRYDGKGGNSYGVYQRRVDASHHGGDDALSVPLGCHRKRPHYRSVRRQRIDGGKPDRDRQPPDHYPTTDDVREQEHGNALDDVRPDSVQRRTVLGRSRVVDLLERRRGHLQFGHPPSIYVRERQPHRRRK